MPPHGVLSIARCRPTRSMPRPRSSSSAWPPRRRSRWVSPSCWSTARSPPTSRAAWPARRGPWRSPAARRTSRSTRRRAKRNARLASRGDNPPSLRRRGRHPRHRSDIIFKMEFAAAESGAVPAAGRPLEGVRVLAVEQMQALPYATQLLARLGADVVKIEPVVGGLGRASLPAMSDPEGRAVGATFLRNNLNKRSMCVDLKKPDGRQLVLDLAPRFDVFAENFKAGAMDRMGLGHDDIVAVHPQVVYASVSAFGNSVPSPYRDRPAFAPIVEAMSGVYEMKRTGDLPPVVSPVGALGDIGAALYTSIGILAALRDRDRTGRPGYVDVAMLDAVMAMTDIVTNYWSMGVEGGDSGTVINHGFRAGDGWFVMQVARVHVFERLARLIGHPEWITDDRFATPYGWVHRLEDVIRRPLRQARRAGCRSPRHRSSHARRHQTHRRCRPTGPGAREPDRDRRPWRRRCPPDSLARRAHGRGLARGARAHRRRDREPAVVLGRRIATVPARGEADGSAGDRPPRTIPEALDQAVV